MGLHERADELYNNSMLQLSANDIPDTLEIDKAFDGAMKYLHSNRHFSSAMLTEKPILNLIEKTTEYLSKGIERGIEISQPSELMVNKLRESAGVFSGFKTFHEMNEASNMLLDADGNIKPFERYLKDVQTINDTYNRNYLRTEYDFTVASSEMAARWEDLANDSDGRYLLQYRTMEDNKVRENHQRLNGITLPSSDSFWDEYYPPNGWGCRCTVVKVRAKKHPATDREEAITAGTEATAGKYSEMFRFNPGKQKSVYPAHNSYTVSKCATCLKNGLDLAKVPSNELCAACPIIRKCAGDIAKSQAAIERTHYLREMEHLLEKKVTVNIDGMNKSVGFNKKGNGHLYSDTFGRSKALAKEHLKELDIVLKNATYIKSEGLSKVRKDNVVQFHYLRSTIDGSEIYFNIAEETIKRSKGKSESRYYVYSITDSIR